MLESDMNEESSGYKILLVDDEEDILEFLSYNLIKLGYYVLTARNGNEALTRVTETEPHLVILDVMMPEMDGIDTCQEIRKIETIRQPLIAFLSARNESYSQIAGFNAGADDYITKPINLKVLESRIKALLKRLSNDAYKVQGSKIEPYKSEPGKLVIDREGYSIIYHKNRLFLPKKEFELLALLTSKPDHVFTREKIYFSVWGSQNAINDRTIDVHVKKLREKIGEEHIRTIKGVGYKYVE
jgi:two-component system alkaline phosphatase synthesis response regulator PhoP